MLFVEDGVEVLLEKFVELVICIVLLIIIEGGYCIDDGSGEFFVELLLVCYDLVNLWILCGVFGFFCEVLWWCCDIGVLVFIVMFCDNFLYNGEVVCKVLLVFVEWFDLGLVCWIVMYVSFFNVMVDCIILMISFVYCC